MESGRLQMYLVAIGWMYVVLMVAVVEAVGGSVLGGVVTFVLYGLLPLGIVLYLMASPARRRVRQELEAAASDDPDRADHAAGDVVAAERKEP